MKDSIERSNELKNIQEGIFSKILGKGGDKKEEEKEEEKSKYIKKTGDDYYLNNNKVYTISNPGGYDIYDDSFWEKPEVSWLISSDVKFYANNIFIRQEGTIDFSGEWYSGEFKGNAFLDVGKKYKSEFKGGYFNGKMYASYNLGYQASPQNYIKGAYLDNKNGILGRQDLSPDKEYNEVELIRVPVNSFLLIETEKRENSFQILKRLDKESTDFVVLDVNNDKKRTIKWEDIRSSYNENGILRVGGIDTTFGSDTLPIKRLSIISSKENLEDEREKGDFLYTIKFPDLNVSSGLEFQVNPSDNNLFLKFKSDVSDKNFLKKLKDIRLLISRGDIVGYGPYTSLKPVFEPLGLKGGERAINENITEEKKKKAEDLLKYFESFMDNVVEKITGEGKGKEMSGEEAGIPATGSVKVKPSKDLVIQSLINFFKGSVQQTDRSDSEEKGGEGFKEKIV